MSTHVAFGMGRCTIPCLLPHRREPPQAPLPGSGSSGIFADLLLRVTKPAVAVTPLVPKARNVHHFGPTHTVRINAHQEMNGKLRAALVRKQSLLHGRRVRAQHQVFPEEIGNLLAVSQVRKG